MMYTLKTILLLLAFFTFLTASELEREFKTSSGKELRVNLIHGGNITIEGWDKDVIQVTARSRGRDLEDDDIKFRERSRGLDISLNPRYHSSGGVQLNIKVPNKYDLDLETMGGDISISNVEGEISGKTMGGDLNFAGIKGELQFTTMGGDITMRDSEVDGNVKTMGGDLDFKNVYGDVKGNTMGGDITMRNPGGKGKASELNLSTMGGDIEVDEAMEGIKAETMGGDIEVRKAGKFLKVKTMGGDIEVKDIDGWVEATTMGGDVQIVMTGDPDQGERDVTLSSMGGEIDLTLPDGISAEFNIELTYTKDSRRNYKIDSDFPLNIEEDEDWDYDNGQARKTIRGTGKTGDGKNDIHIETINGNITIRKK